MSTVISYPRDIKKHSNGIGNKVCENQPRDSANRIEFTKLIGERL